MERERIINLIIEKKVQLYFVYIWDNVFNYNMASKIPLTQEEFTDIKKLVGGK